MDYNSEILSLNARGLNDSGRRDSIREFVVMLKVNLVCIQETNLEVVDSFVISQCLGPSFDGFAFLPATGTRGGILVAWDTSVIAMSRISLDSFSLNAEVHTLDRAVWWLTVVYGPQGTEDKTKFLQELSERRLLCHGPWLILGDFNLILNAADKSNSNLDRSMMRKFKDFVVRHELKDLYLHGRRFTWSNGRERPTLTRIDRALVSVD